MNPETLLKQGLKDLGISCSSEQIKAFMIFLAELKKWNRAYSLTAMKTDEDIIIKHFFDSILYLKAIPETALKIADAGTGAGFPGIPVKIIKPEIGLTLIDSSRKKCAFLRHIIRTLNLNMVGVAEKRVEALGKEYENSYDVIVSRATFKIKDFLKKACPYVKKDGVLILSKGPKAAGEINEIGNREITGKIQRLQFALKVSPTGQPVERNLLIIRCK